MSSALERLGRYGVLAPMGAGRFGEVYRVRHPDLARELVARVCSVEDPALRHSFVEEGRKAARLVQSNIVRTYDVGLEDGVPFLVQELVAGETMESILRANAPRTPVADLDLLRQVGRALVHAHSKGIVHSALRPGCIHRTPDGTIKVRDFGLARLVSAGTQVDSQSVSLDDAAYLAPEQVRGGEIDRRTDVFALGVLAYRFLTGELPFRGEHLSALVYQILYKEPLPVGALWPECPEPLSALVASCLQKKSPDRPADLEKVLEELARIRDEAVDGRWPTLLAARRAGRAEADPDATRISPSEISETARALSAGEATLAVPFEVLEGRAAPPVAPEEDPFGTLSSPPDGPLASARTHRMAIPPIPVPDPPPPAADRTLMGPDVEEPSASRPPPDSPLATKEMEAVDGEAEDEGLPGPDDATIARLSDPAPVPSPPVPETPSRPRFEGDPELEEAASEIGRLVAAGNLDAARRALDQTISGRVVDGAREETGDPRSGAGTGTALPVRGRRTRVVWLVAVGLAAVLAAGLAYWVGRRTATVEQVVVRPPAAPSLDLPVETPSSVVAVQGRPWARLTEIHAEDGSPIELPEETSTPLRLDLPPGSYRLVLSHPDAEQDVECEVLVSPEGTGPCFAEMLEPTAHELLREAGWWR